MLLHFNDTTNSQSDKTPELNINVAAHPERGGGGKWGRNLKEEPVRFGKSMNIIPTKHPCIMHKHVFFTVHVCAWQQHQVIVRTQNQSCRRLKLHILEGLFL